jgi:DNA mismatch endonuclease, patch repair protein
MPSHNVTAWREKFEANVKRDRRNRRDLIAAGWQVFVAWGCEIAKDPQSVARTLMEKLVDGEIDQ